MAERQSPLALRPEWLAGRQSGLALRPEWLAGRQSGLALRAKWIARRQSRLRLRRESDRQSRNWRAAAHRSLATCRIYVTSRHRPRECFGETGHLRRQPLGMNRYEVA